MWLMKKPKIYFKELRRLLYMDQRLDEKIIEFNKRYQEAVFSNERLIQEKRSDILQI